MNLEISDFVKKIKIGVCVMEKKVKCGLEVLSFQLNLLVDNTKQSV